MLAPDRSQLAARGKVRGLVAAVSSHAADVARFATGFSQDCEHILQRLLELRGERLRMKTLLRVLAHLAGNEHDPPCFGHDAIGVADGRRPAVGQKNPQFSVPQSV
jgi:hypothetical protein